MIKITHYLQSTLLAIGEMEIFTYPLNKVILEYPLDELVKDVWCEQFMDVGSRKTVCKRLRGISNASE